MRTRDRCVPTRALDTARARRPRPAKRWSPPRPPRPTRLPALAAPAPTPQVSAKSGQNVEEAFLAVVKAAASRVKEEEPLVPDTLKLSDVKPASKSGCAC